MDQKIREALDILDLKERTLSEIIIWLKAKGLWEECQKDLFGDSSTKIVLNSGEKK